MKILVLIYVLLVNNFVSDPFVVSQYVHNRGYYWRDYDGLITPDAVQGGNIDGKITYIGQILMSNISSILLANIFQNKTVLSPYGEASLQDNDIKVLCTKNKRLLQWIKVTPDKFPKPSDLIYGGFQDGIRLYIGRFVYGNNTIIGNVFDNITLHKEGLHIYTNDGETITTTYDVLAHRTPMKDYYWRDYIGYIPVDAIEGGIIYEEQSYIGQAMIERESEVEDSDYNYRSHTTKTINPEMIPSNIFAGNLTAIAYFNNTFTIDTNLKILCSGHKQNFVWVSEYDLDKYKREDFIIGGFFKNTSYLIGKMKTDIGEIVRYIHEEEIPYPSMRKFYDYSIELLAYKT